MQIKFTCLLIENQISLAFQFGTFFELFGENSRFDVVL